MELCGVKLKMSTSRHPQTDGASEIMNRMVKNYLRCYYNYHQDTWDELLPAAEFAYNSAINGDLGMRPFEMDLGWKPKSQLELISGARREDVNEIVEDFRRKLKVSLEDAQFSHKVAKAKQSAERGNHYKVPSYAVGYEVWLAKSLWKDTYARSQASEKLAAKRFGPFRIPQPIGRNAIRLDLPLHCKIHPVVHVSRTRPFIQQPSDIGEILSKRPDPIPAVVEMEYEVEKILKHRKRGQGYQWLTLMKGTPTHEAQCQPTGDFADEDKTTTKAFYGYIKKNNLIQHLWG